MQFSNVNGINELEMMCRLLNGVEWGVNVDYLMYWVNVIKSERVGLFIGMFFFISSLMMLFSPPYSLFPFIAFPPQEGKAELYENSHPDPYCVPYMPGGSLFMRNPPPPLSICFPDGNYPADAPTHTMNPDMTICRPETGKSAVGGVLVDFGKKNME